MATILRVLAFPFALALLTPAVLAQDGVLNKRTFDASVAADPIIELLTVVEPTAFAPTGVAFNDPIDPAFTGDLDTILANSGLTRFDVYNVVFFREVLDPIEDEESNSIVTEEPGTIFIGDIEDPCNITVITGQVNVITTITTTTTPRFNDTLMIQTYVPEPGSLVGLITAGLVVAQRRRKR